MNGQKSLALRHEVQEGIGLRRRDGVPVGVEHEGIVLTQGLGVEVGKFIGVGKIDTLASQCFHDSRHAVYRTVMSIIPQEEYFQATRLHGGIPGARPKQQDTQ